MSGGSWDYISYRLEEVADRLDESLDKDRKDLGKLMHLIARAMHEIEWVDSDDNSPGDETFAIKAALNFKRKI